VQGKHFRGATRVRECSFAFRTAHTHDLGDNLLRNLAVGEKARLRQVVQVEQLGRMRKGDNALRDIVVVEFISSWASSIALPAPGTPWWLTNMQRTISSRRTGTSCAAASSGTQ
jgi:hypothetical protein